MNFTKFCHFYSVDVQKCFAQCCRSFENKVSISQFLAALCKKRINALPAQSKDGKT